jgi:hypothetical protein
MEIETVRKATMIIGSTTNSIGDQLSINENNGIQV